MLPVTRHSLKRWPFKLVLLKAIVYGKATRPGWTKVTSSGHAHLSTTWPGWVWISSPGSGHTPGDSPGAWTQRFSDSSGHAVDLCNPQAMDVAFPGLGLVSAVPGGRRLPFHNGLGRVSECVYLG